MSDDIDRKAVSQRNKYIRIRKASQNSRIIEKRRSLLGRSKTATRTSAARSKILGKNRESAVRKNSKRKSLAKYAGSVGKNAAGLATDTARQAKAQIKKYSCTE